MARRVKFDPTGFSFGANAPRRKPRGGKGNTGAGGKKSNAWRAYAGGGRSSAPLPD
ncbi:MAG TPA: hypothetical protein VFW33_21835 [Gemmataceae bacterium]|nr:hypothetical protein [Gemmataceae bacterium]